MPDEIRVNRQMPSQPMMQPAMQPAEMPSAKSSKMAWMIFVVIVIVVVVLGVLFRDKLFKGSGVSSTVMMKDSGYQAVFLTNGQVYFGKIGEMDKDFLSLSDIYYLQVVQPPLQGSQAQGQGQAQQSQPQISLVKLGNELHGPMDLMHISRAQILFYEDLKEDGQVVKAIMSYKANPSGQPAK